MSSVVGNVLDETIDGSDLDIDFFGNSFKLLNNTAVVDEVAGKFGVPEEERAQLKLDLEEQTRDEIQCCRFLLSGSLALTSFNISRKSLDSIVIDPQVGARHPDRQVPRDAVLAIEKEKSMSHSLTRSNVWSACEPHTQLLTLAPSNFFEV